MLPQPNFGRDREPDKGAPEPEADPDARPRKLLRLQIAMWVQVVSAIVAGNMFAFSVFTFRSASLESLESLHENPDYLGPTGSAQGDYDYYHSTGFLTAYLSIAGIILVAGIIAALCAVRFKSRLKAVRWWAVGTSAVLFIAGMLMSPAYGLLVAPWVFASVLALWWLFSSDVRHWMDRRQAKTRRAPEAEEASGD